MINIASQLVSTQGSVAHAPSTASRKEPGVPVSGDESHKDASVEFNAGMDASSTEELADVIDQMNGYLESTHRGLRFSIDEDSGRTVVRVIDTESDKVIRQIPSEEMLVMIRHFNEITGNLFDSVA